MAVRRLEPVVVRPVAARPRFPRRLRSVAGLRATPCIPERWPARRPPVLLAARERVELMRLMELPRWRPVLEARLLDWVPNDEVRERRLSVAGLRATPCIPGSCSLMLEPLREALGEELCDAYPDSMSDIVFWLWW